MERLARLSRRDRDWILAHLSADAKANLRRQVRRAPGDTDAEAAGGLPALHDERELDALDGGMVAAYLAAEPSWVIAMIMSVREWRWETQVLAKTPPVTRLEVSQLRGSLPRVSGAMRSLVMRTLRAQLLPMLASESRFDQLLDRAQLRAGHRP
jgi:hypothetical protein